MSSSCHLLFGSSAVEEFDASLRVMLCQYPYTLHAERNAFGSGGAKSNRSLPTGGTIHVVHHMPPRGVLPCRSVHQCQHAKYESKQASSTIPTPQHFLDSKCTVEFSNATRDSSHRMPSSSTSIDESAQTCRQSCCVDKKWHAHRHSPSQQKLVEIT